MRRLNIQNIKHAKNVAKTLQGSLRDLGHEMKLSTAQQITAAAMGYASWHDLESNGIASTSGPYDDEISADEAIQRKQATVNALLASGVYKAAALCAISMTQPTSRPGRALPPLVWSKMPDGLFEGRGDKTERYIVARGTEVPAVSGSNLLDLANPDKELALLPRIKGEGFTAMEANENGVTGRSGLVWGETLEDAKASLEVWRNRQSKSREGHFEKLLAKLTDEGSVEICDGLTFTWDDHGGYFHVSASRMLDILPPFRPAAIPHDGVEYGRSWDGCFVVLSLPEYFSANEIRYAMDTVKSTYPAAYRAMKLGDQASEADIRASGRGIRREHINWCVYRVLTVEHDGSRIVVATALSSWGPDDGIDNEFFEKRHMFRIKAENVVSVFGTLDASDPEQVFRMCSFEGEENEYLGTASVDFVDYTEVWRLNGC